MRQPQGARAQCSPRKHRLLLGRCHEVVGEAVVTQPAAASGDLAANRSRPVTTPRERCQLQGDQTGRGQELVEQHRQGCRPRVVIAAAGRVVTVALGDSTEHFGHLHGCRIRCRALLRVTAPRHVNDEHGGALMLLACARGCADQQTGPGCQVPSIAFACPLLIGPV